MEGLSYDGFVAGVGTGGTITGTGSVLKKHNPAVHIAAIEPADSAVLSGGEPGARDPGDRAGFVPDVLDTKIYNEVIKVTNVDAATPATKRLAMEGRAFGGDFFGSGICCGPAGGQEAGHREECSGDPAGYR